MTRPVQARARVGALDVGRISSWCAVAHSVSMFGDLTSSVAGLKTLSSAARLGCSGRGRRRLRAVSGELVGDPLEYQFGFARL